MEGLTVLMQRTVYLGNYHGFKVCDNLQFHMLQFVDDLQLLLVMIDETIYDQYKWFYLVLNLSLILKLTSLRASYMVLILMIDVLF